MLAEDSKYPLAYGEYENMGLGEWISCKNFGFVSTRFAGTDGVSLEALKWAGVLEKSGHQSFWFAGKLDREPEKSMLVSEAYFEHPEIVDINAQIFGKLNRSRKCTCKIYESKERLKTHLYNFIDKFCIDVMVAENSLTIPMNIPLGLAIMEILVETGMPAIAHHHDFYWERDRYVTTGASDYLHAAFPPRLRNIQHAVINSSAREQLAHRKGLSSFVIPNVVDFSQPVPRVDDFSATFREDIGLKPDDVLILQPTRVVSRKGIEHAIDLVQRLGPDRYKLVVSHEAGDEGMEYQEFLKEHAAGLGVDMRIVSTRVASLRSVDKDNGRKHYTLWDVYPHADLVTYPSLYEGFGNAFLEAVYFRKPLMVNRYSIYIRDIEPKGFKTIEMDGYVSRSVVEEVRKVLEDADYRQNVVDQNFNIARRYYSFEVLERKLGYLLANVFGLDAE